MADPRSYAGTVLPSGGVDPLKLMGQMQAQKQKRDAAAQKAQTPKDIAFKGVLPQDRPILNMAIKDVQAKWANPQSFIAGTKENMEAERARQDLNNMMEQMAWDAKAHEELQKQINAEDGMNIREESLAENMAFWEGDWVARSNSKQPGNLVRNVDWRAPVDASLDKLDPVEWGSSETADGGATIRTTSGKTLSKQRVDNLAKSFAFDPRIWNQLDYEAGRRMTKDPNFAAVVADNEAKGIDRATSMVLEHVASKPYSGGDEKLTQSGAGFGAGDVANAQVIADKLSAVSMGQGHMFGYDDVQKRDLLANFEDARQEVRSRAHKLKAPLSYAEAMAGEDGDLAGVKLIEGENFLTTGRYAYNPNESAIYFQVYNKDDDMYDWIPMQRGQLQYTAFFDKGGPAVRKAGVKYIKDKNAWDESSGMTDPSKIITRTVPAGGAPTKGPKPQQATGTPTKGPRPTNP